MKHFKYKAKKGPSEIVEDVITAESRENAVDKINELGLVPVDVQEFNGKKKVIASQEVHVKNRKAKARDVLAFYRQLGKLVRSGVPILQALYLLSSENENRFFQGVVRELHKDVREGSSLSTAMSEFPKVFGAFDIGMVQTGEAAGRLDEVLARIAEYREKQQQLLSKVRGALAYPAFIVVMGFFSVAFILTNVIPKFSSFYRDLGQELPWITRFLIVISSWMQSNFAYLVVGASAIGLLLMTLLKKESNRVGIDDAMLRVPLLGNLILKSETARFCRTMELLLRSGVSILSATRIAVPVIRNSAIKKRLADCHQIIQEGGNLSECLKRAGYFPAFVTYFVGVGEESGSIDESLREVAEWYEQDTAEAVKIMTSLLEPVIILVIGVILAVIIIAVLLPVFSVNTMIS